MEKEYKDPADFFQERDFPGRKLIAWGVGIWAVHWLLTGWIFRMNAFSEEINLVASLPLIPAAVLFLVGFWKAVKGKGYHPVLFLIAFTGFIGLLVLFFLPDQSKQKDNQSLLEND
ncbi:hypothetical protein [Cerasicoccus fimbriatus]|uniref:hypothetical protein n=1 Tax=Cerasicoccus fimbriatus TaxID=3014554 RepID=UPI0022B4944C|nr:hypothetical protein [Cerasicoccus sp. TK19100]